MYIPTIQIPGIRTLKVDRGTVAKVVGGRRLGQPASVPSGHAKELLDTLVEERRDG